MSFIRTSPGVRIFIGVLASLALFAFFAHRPHMASSSSDIPLPHMADRADESPIGRLDVKLKQSAGAPPTIVVTVTNNNKKPVTILSYGSPLDGVALQTGLLHITKANGKPLEFATIEAQRQWPPPEDAVITVAPGESKENEIVLREPIIPMDKLGHKAEVVLKGKWDAVWWRGKGDGVSEEALERGVVDVDAYKGEYVTEKLEITTG